MIQNFGIFSKDIDFYSKELEQLYNKYKNLGDIVLFTDDLNSTKYSDLAIFPSFYMRFFNGCILFLTVGDYIEFKDKIKGDKKILLNNNYSRDIHKIDSNDILRI